MILAALEQESVKVVEMSYAQVKLKYPGVNHPSVLIAWPQATADCPGILGTEKCPRKLKRINQK